jgi:hypothetical protein
MASVRDSVLPLAMARFNHDSINALSSPSSENRPF